MFIDNLSLSRQPGDKIACNNEPIEEGYLCEQNVDCLNCYHQHLVREDLRNKLPD